MILKPFNQVKPGDIGENYGGESGVVRATGTYAELFYYDSTGACQDLEADMKNQMVGVEIDSELLLYVYGEDGFAVYAEWVMPENPNDHYISQAMQDLQDLGPSTTLLVDVTTHEEYHVIGSFCYELKKRLWDNPGITGRMLFGRTPR